MVTVFDADLMRSGPTFCVISTSSIELGGGRIPAMMASLSGMTQWRRRFKMVFYVQTLSAAANVNQRWWLSNLWAERRSLRMANLTAGMS